MSDNIRHIDYSHHNESQLSPSLTLLSLERLSYLQNQTSNLRISKFNIEEPHEFLSLTVEPLRKIFSDSEFTLERKSKELKIFCNGTQYVGEWNNLGIAGRGIYTYPHGVVYDGQFNDNGQFHGNGTMIYPNGMKVNGVWKNGRLIEISESRQRLEEKKQRKEQALMDRRYPLEINYYFEAPGFELVTNTHSPTPLPHSCFDVGNGIFVHNSKIIIPYKKKRGRYSIRLPLSDKAKSEPEVNTGHQKFLKSVQCQKQDQFQVPLLKTLKQENINVDGVFITDLPDDAKEKWILKHCRGHADEPIGYDPRLYEVFTTGIQEDIEKIAKGNFKTEYEDKDNDSDINNNLIHHVKFSVATSKKIKHNKKKKPVERFTRINLGKLAQGRFQNYVSEFENDFIVM